MGIGLRLTSRAADRRCAGSLKSHDMAMVRTPPGVAEDEFFQATFQSHDRTAAASRTPGGGSTPRVRRDLVVAI